MSEEKDDDEKIEQSSDPWSSFEAEEREEASCGRTSEFDGLRLQGEVPSRSFGFEAANGSRIRFIASQDKSRIGFV